MGSKLHRKTWNTHSGDSKIVYSQAYPQAYLQAYPQALPSNLYVGDHRCGHSSNLIVQDVCLFCFLQDGFQNELPGRLHLGRQLADNGNPEQAPRLISHVQVVEGFRPPRPNQNLRSYRLARKQYSRPAHGLFPFTSALWELMGYQPPLAIPLIRAISGENLPKIAENLDISIYNLQNRIEKGIKLTLGFLRA